VKVLDGYPPIISVTTKLNSTVNGTIRIEGSAQSSGIRSIQKVEYKVDSLNWQNAEGKESWRFFVNTRMLNNGKHVLQIRAFDGTDYSTESKIEFYVMNKVSSTDSNEKALFYSRLVVAILVGVLCLSIGGVVGRLSRKRTPYPMDEGFTREYADVERVTRSEYLPKPE
ncbi:MAG: Ig-like domain-containing protein, partial [Thermoplasmata archaeon]